MCVGTGVDAALGRAIGLAPLARVLKDDDKMISESVTGVLRLLQARMRWPGAARVALAAVTIPNLDEPNSALLGLLKQLYMGTDKRHVIYCCILSEI
jgi:hypothetical protein